MPYLSTKPDPKNPRKEIAYLEDRETLGHWAGKQIEQGVMNKYRAEWNRRSLDGLPGLRIARQDFGENLLLGDVKARVSKTGAVAGGNLVVLLLLLILTAVVSSLLTVAGLYFFDLTTFPSARGRSVWGFDL